jgi:hypothetical protein
MTTIVALLLLTRLTLSKMPNWKEVLDEIHQEIHNQEQAPLDKVRRKYLAKIAEHTHRNVIAYYSGWLQRPQSVDAILNDKDKNAFMVNIHELDRTKGLDLILHTPGGEIAATESIVDYIFSMFGNNVRAIIPQISMSAGTMIAFSCREVMMGKQSNLGPTDPQIGGVACQAVLDEFRKAISDIQVNPSSAPLWQVIVSKYHPTFLGTCESSIKWSEKLVRDWLGRNMLADDPDIIEKVIKEFGDHSNNMSHSRHISKQQCKDVGIKVIDMEDDNELQDLILTSHHAFMHTFSNSSAVKIVENHLGIAYVENLP